MRLRTKLTLVALVALVLPGAAWRFLHDAERFLRAGEERALQASAQVIARAAAEDYQREPWGSGLFVRRLSTPLQLDGYLDDWSAWADYRERLGEDAGFALAEDADGLYLMVEVRDQAVVYAASEGGSSRPGDHLLLTLQADGRPHLYLVSTEAPGWVQAEPLGSAGVGRVRGEWQESAAGYSVELRLPRGLSALGLAVADSDSADGGFSLMGAEPGAAPVPRPLVRPRPAPMLQALAPAGSRIWLLNGDGWVLARAGSLRAEEAPAVHWLEGLAYRALLASPLSAVQAREGALRLQGEEIAAALAGSAAASWRPLAEEAGVVASAAAPVVVDGQPVGAVVVEQAGDALLAVTNRAALRLMGTTTLAFGAALMVLMLFAARLSARIRRLRDAAEAAVAPDGGISAVLPLAGDRDELGDLSRAFTRTLAELREHTGYLRTLADKLSHELRTPLAVVSSSLDNLAQAALPPGAVTYMDRARQGAERLNRILRAMSEANRLEQSLTREDPEWFDLADLLRGATQAYGELASAHAFELNLDADPARLHGSPELIAQLLDKLVDNAVSFAPPGGWIRIRLLAAREGLELRVANQGPPLPERMRGHLFDSMVSVREQRDGRPHLGLGLYIVRLIAEAHGGGVRAENLADGGGAEFVVTLRGMPARKARQEASVAAEGLA